MHRYQLKIMLPVSDVVGTTILNIILIPSTETGRIHVCFGHDKALSIEVSCDALLSAMNEIEDGHGWVIAPDATEYELAWLKAQLARVPRERVMFVSDKELWISRTGKQCHLKLGLGRGERPYQATVDMADLLDAIRFCKHVMDMVEFDFTGRVRAEPQ